MTYWELERLAKTFYPVLALESLFPRKMRARLLILFSVLAFLSGLAALPAFFTPLAVLLTPIVANIALISHISESLFLEFLAFAAIVFALHTYVNSYFFRGFNKGLRVFDN